MKPLQRLVFDESVLGLLIVPAVPLRFSVFNKLAEAMLSLLSGRFSGEGPVDLVRGRAKCATGMVFCGEVVDVAAALFLAIVAPSDMDGITRLVLIEWAEDRRECLEVSWNSATPESDRPLMASREGNVMVLAAGG